jgi:ankyrin repeat protein
MDAVWFDAAKRGDTPAIVGRLDDGADIDARGEHGMTALMCAVAGGHFETMEVLLRRGADPNAEMPYNGWTAMTWAALEARGLRVVQGRCWPTHTGDARAMNVLASAGGRLGLREAILLGDVELVRRACDTDPTLDINGESRFGMHETHLMLAATLGPLAVVDLLLERGADIEGTDDIGHTALMRAAESGHEDIVRRLLDLGADINRNWPMTSALAQAQGRGHQGVTALLLSRGARRHMSEAIDTDDLALARGLLLVGVDPDSFEFPGYPFVRHAMHAVSRGNVDMVRLLLEQGASLHESCTDRHPLLVEAASRGHIEVVRLLIAHGADVGAAGKDGRTPYDEASEAGHTAVMDELKLAGAVRC